MCSLANLIRLVRSICFRKFFTLLARRPASNKRLLTVHKAIFTAFAVSLISSAKSNGLSMASVIDYIRMTTINKICKKIIINSYNNSLVAVFVCLTWPTASSSYY